MSYDHPIEIHQNDVRVDSVLGADRSYFMMQKGLTEEVGSEDSIYFGFDDQINGDHNTVTECIVTTDGIHVAHSNKKKASRHYSCQSRYRRFHSPFR